MKVIVQNFNCETREDSFEYPRIIVDCALIVDKHGIGIDAVKQSRIRKAIVEAVGEAVSLEGESPNRKEAEDGRMA